MQKFFDSHLSEGLKLIRLFDYVDDLVFMMKVEDNGFSYQYINQAVKEVLMFDETVVGRMMHEVVQSPEEAAILLNQYEEVRASREPFKFVHTLANSTRSFIGDATLYPMLDEEGTCTHILAIVKDITEKFQLEQKLRENEARYRLIAENSLDVIKLINPDGMIEYVSPSSQVIVGFPPDMYVGKHFKEFLFEEERDAVLSQFDTILKEAKSITVEVKHLHHDGHYVWMEIIATPVIQNDVVTQIVTSARDISERMEYREKLARMAFHDYLSGLPNRRLFEDRLEMALRQADRHQTKVGLIMIDGQNFKQINDTYGHEMGDEIIKQLARRLELAVREGDTVARLGGDEFAIVLPDLENISDATIVAQRIVREFEKPCEICNHTIYFTVDIGIAIYPDHTTTQKELIRLADEAMYLTKSDNKSTYYVYQPSVVL